MKKDNESGEWVTNENPHTPDWHRKLVEKYENGVLEEIIKPVFGDNFTKIPYQLNMGFDPVEETQTHGELYSLHEGALFNEFGYKVDKSLRFLHFTDLTSCKDILNSKSFWLSNLNRLNDKQEISFAGKYLQFTEEEYHNIKQEVFVLSMCNYISDNVEIGSNLHNIDLWEKYGDKGKGVVFELLFNHQDYNQFWKNFYVGDVKYGEQECDGLRQLMKHIDLFNDKYPNLYYKHLFYKLIAFHKHAAWSSEKETRLIYQTMVSKMSLSNAGKQVFPTIIDEGGGNKHFEMPLPCVDDSGNLDFDVHGISPLVFINKIHLGPEIKNIKKVQKEISQLAIDSLGYKVEVVLSDVDQLINFNT